MRETRFPNELMPMRGGFLSREAGLPQRGGAVPPQFGTFADAAMQPPPMSQQQLSAMAYQNAQQMRPQMQQSLFNAQSQMAQGYQPQQTAMQQAQNALDQMRQRGKMPGGGGGFFGGMPGGPGGGFLR